MSLVFAHPFRITGGRIVTVESESDAGYAQEIAVLCSTYKGERVLVPDYGISDPIGSSIEVAEINACLALYGPGDVTVSDYEYSYPDNTTQLATLTFGTD